MRVLNFIKQILCAGARFGCFASLSAAEQRINEGHKNAKYSGMSTNIFAANPLLLFCMMVHVARSLSLSFHLRLRV